MVGRAARRSPAIGHRRNGRTYCKARRWPLPKHRLLQGESGTGKEVVPVHPWRVAAKGGAVCRDQLRGAPTTCWNRSSSGTTAARSPAPSAQAGQIELASGGVLFLDECGDERGCQGEAAPVLRRRVPAPRRNAFTKPNVRVIAATNRNLREAVARGAFREDLYYRLQVFEIQLPPLRERTRDIPLLVEAFLRDISRTIGRAPTDLTREANDLLLNYAWPGNIRELRNALERAAILWRADSSRSPPVAHTDPIARSSTPTADLRGAERRAIEKALRETDGNKAKTARRLGLTRTQLYVRLRKYDIDQPAVS